ncbi:MAG: UvrD-helicase domain-containing protein [Oscillospiraceae bacterium]|nr:UvrD-helicase domain-containing protein [Oscillospiraceae bacterium]
MYIADLHIHSKYSRATSRDCDAPHLDFWARRKGIRLLGTGDFTHPAWRAELAQQLMPAEEGLYVLREEFCLPDKVGGEAFIPRFILSGEISSIYKKGGRVRKVHNLILLPSLEDAESLSHRLEAIGNIRSDGRPILGLDSRDLLEITLEVCPQAVFIPAHIWTPHFSLFGAFSGFDTVEACFEDLTPYIHAVETGLSSDPPMNWRVSALDRFTLVSNSDAHSPARLGREVNLLDTGLSYLELARAIQTGEGFAGTVEFFPEEGKYHLDGHRSCQLCLTPAQTAAYGGRCPVCEKKITIGVQHRVEELADRPEGSAPSSAKPFESLAPLPEVIAASTGLSAASKKVLGQYEGLLERLGPEFEILRRVPLEEIRRQAGPSIAEGIRRLRAGQVRRIPGYDGEYGKILLLSLSERQALEGQTSLFGISSLPDAVPAPSKPISAPPSSAPQEQSNPKAVVLPDRLNQEQFDAVHAPEPAVAVVAGPGTGKTKTLVARIAYLIGERGVSPSQITAVTFTNLAAAELRQRLEEQLGGKRAVRGLTVGTFHSICRTLLGEVSLAAEPDAMELAAHVIETQGLSISPRRFLQEVSQIKNGADRQTERLSEESFQQYQSLLTQRQLLDFDDLLLRALAGPTGSLRRFTHLLVDEFQDVNDLQYRLIRRWSKGGQGLFVIGDPDQAIYGFRGAGSDCFSRLESDLPHLRTIYLRQNYRSSPQILSAALSAIAPNPGPDRVLLSNRPDGDPICLIQAQDDWGEAIAIARQIARMTGGMGMLEAQSPEDGQQIRSFSEIAVLCRTHRQLLTVEKCLRHDSIPCVVSGREDYLSDSQVRGILGFFRSLRQIRDTAALENALRFLWRCPADVIEQAAETVRGLECWDISLLRDRWQPYPHLTPWLDEAEKFLPLTGKENPRKLLDRWQEGRPLSPAVEKLQNASVFFHDLNTFLDAALMGQEGDLRRTSGSGISSGAVRLITLHGAKGLEFPAVFLAGVKKGSIPLETAKGEVDPQEERRLFFVGLTRAQEELFLTTSGEPSAFLSDLSAEKMRVKPAAARPVQAEQLSLFSL